MAGAKTHDKDHFEKVLARLFEVLVLGKTNMKIGRGILHEITSDQTLAHVCRVFWGTTITAHLDAAQMAAFKLFDSRSGSMTVKYLLELANQCSDSFQKATPIQVQSIIDAARAKIDKLNALNQLNSKRNRILAHIDPTIVLDPQRLAKATQVTFVDLEAVFETAGEILNDISIAFRDTSSFLELLDDDDLKMMVQLVADAKHDQVDRYEKEFGVPAPFDRPDRPKSFS